ncbi:MAG: hypothetical protein P4L96_15465 [Rhodoferax sp.]|nr:hypothetical protein [Rhodoferax sp.]
MREPLVVLGASLKVISASRPFYRFFRVSPEETVGRVLYALGNSQWDTPSMRKLLDNILRSNTSFDDVEVDAVFQGIGPRKMRLNARRIIGTGDGATQTKPLILVAMEEVVDPQVSTSGKGEQQDGQQIRWCCPIAQSSSKRACSERQNRVGPGCSAA